MRYMRISFALILLLQKVRESAALKCHLVPMVTDGDSPEDDEIISYKCQIGDRILDIDNHLDQFDDFLEGPHGGVMADFDLEFNKATIVDHKFHIPSDTRMSYDRIKEGGVDGNTRRGRHRRLGGKDPVGDQRVLVLYVEDGAGNTPDYVKDGQTGSIEDNIFGTYGDAVYPGERYSTCSQGHVDFVPWTGTTDTGVEITTGVYQVTISNIVDGTRTSIIQDAVTVQATTDLGDLRNQFDYVMMCLPYGSTNGSGSKGWGGYAYINHWLQVLNNNRCQRVSTMVHEFGHNLNLGHSGDYRTPAGSQAYADQVGFMGYSYSGDDTPLMCFNGPKTFQLNWFPNHYKTLTTPDYNWSGYLYHSSDIIGTTEMMIVKIPGFTSTSSNEYLDYYISFNKASGANSGTIEARNKVAIHTSQSESYVWAPKSKLVAELAAGEDFEFTALGVDVIVTATAINTASAIPYATITIASGTESPSVSQVPSTSLVPTQAPSLPPSDRPSPVGGITHAPSSEFYQLMTNFLVGEFWAAAESGIMFDITVTEDTIITRLDIDLFYVNYDGLTFSTDIEIYTKAGSYAGHQANSASWTKHMDRTTITPPNVDDVSTFGLTPLKSDILSPIVIPGGTTLAIYITNRDVKNFIEMAYSSTAVDYVSDDNVMTVKKGLFQQYDEFTGEENDGWWWVPVAFSGIIYYEKTASNPSDQPTEYASGAPSTSIMPSLEPSSQPSQEPSVSIMPSLEPSLKPSLYPSTYPSLKPSAEPSVSVMPSLKPSSHPSQEPSVSVMPSLKPSSHPSEKPSVSVMPSLEPSAKPSKSPSSEPTNKPSRAPTSAPSSSPSQLPTGEPSPSPTKNPTRRPTKAPTKDTAYPSASPKPSYSPTRSPTLHPTTSMVPTEAPVITPSPSAALFQVITTRCYCRSPFRGISQTDLQNRFSAIVSLLQSVMQKLLGPDRSNWGTRVVRVGSINTRRLSIFRVAEILSNQDDEVEVEYEFTNSQECISEDGCTVLEQEASVQEGLAVLSTVEAVVNSGELQQTIVEDSESVGLTEELANVVVNEVVVSTPEVVVIETTAYPSIYTTPAPMSPTSSPTYDCEDSPLRFKVKKDGELISRTCSWVRFRRNSRCQLPGIREHCPQSCWRCRNCADSTLNFQFEFKGIKGYRSCEWVGQTNALARCDAVEGLSDTCPLTCGTCFRKTGSPSIPPSDSPTIPPTSAPTPKVTAMPSLSTSSPSITPACNDSPFRFKVVKDGKKITRSCDWVAAVPTRCSLDGVPSVCPQTCGACDTCVDSSLTMKIGDDNNFQLCSQSLCSIEGVKDSCRATCGSCCSDYTEQFEFTYNGKVINRFCEWAGRKDTVTRCAISEVSKNCPVTCGGSCCSDYSEMFQFPYNGKVINRSCEWAGRKDKVTRCAISEVLGNCPETCGTCSE